MNIKNILATMVLIGCLILLLASYLSWKEKTEAFTGTAPVKFDETLKDKSASTNETDPIASEPKTELSKDQLVEHLSNTDDAVRSVFVNRLTNDEQLQVLILGSEAMKLGTPSLAERIKTSLEDSYRGFVEVDYESFDTTSDVFIEEYIDGIDWSVGYDVVVFEPFTLNNNGFVVIEDEHGHIEKIQAIVREQVADAVLVINPSHPIHAATYYPTQIEALKSFAESNAIPFINHWSEWPNHQSEEINEFLTDDGAPNEEGLELWSNVVIEYFIKK